MLYKEETFRLFWHKPHCFTRGISNVMIFLPSKTLCLMPSQDQCWKVTYVKTRRSYTSSSLCAGKLREARSLGCQTRECLRCQLGNYAEKKAKGKTNGYVQISGTRLLRDILLEGLAVVLGLTDVVTAPKLVTYIWHKGKDLTEEWSPLKKVFQQGKQQCAVYPRRCTIKTSAIS